MASTQDGATFAFDNKHVFLSTDNFAGAEGNNFYSVDAVTGNETWSQLPGIAMGAPSVTDGTVYFGVNIPVGYVFALDEVTGAEKWRYKQEGYGFGAPTASNGLVYVGCDNGNLMALDGKSGAVQWKLKTKDFVISASLVAGENVYFTSKNFTGFGGYITAASTGGNEIWQFRSEGSIQTSPVLADGMVFAGDGNGILYALDAQNGTERWRFKTQTRINESPATADGTVYVSSNDGNLYAIDMKTGQEKWSFKTGDSSLASTPAIEGQTLYFGGGSTTSSDKYLYAINTQTGQELWKFKADGAVYSPQVYDGTIYFRCGDKYLYAVSSATGRQIFPLICVMVNPAGESFNPNAEETLKRTVTDVQHYYFEASGGRLQLDPVWITNNGNGIPLQHDDRYYIDKAPEFATDVRNLDAVKPSIPASADFSIVAFQPGKDGRQLDKGNKQVQVGQSSYSCGWWDQWLDASGNPENRGGSLVNMPADQGGDEVAVLAHEIAHGLGSQVIASPAAEYNKTPPRKSQLPDLYNIEADAPWGYTNINTVWGRYFLMGDRTPVLPSGFSQEWFDWVEWKNINKGEKQIIVPYLDGKVEAVAAIPRIVTESPAGGSIRKSYFVLEARNSSGHGDWESNIPKPGVLVYQMTDSVLGERHRDRTGWPLSANVYKLLTPSEPIWINVDQGYFLKLTSSMAPENGHETVDYEELKPLPASDLSNLANLAGVILRLNVNGVPKLDASGPAAAPGEESIGGVPTPDLDLHAYLSDGTHIGMNYETGEFENPIAKATVSGDLSIASEWILVPAEKAAGIRFEITARDTQDYSEAYPDPAREQQLELEYTVEPVVLGDDESALYRGEKQTGRLGSGTEASTSMNINDTDTSLGPLEIIQNNPEPRDESPAWASPLILIVLIGGLIILPGAGLAYGILRLIRKLP